MGPGPVCADGIDWSYIFQGTHTTTGGYVDKINLNVKESGGHAVLRASSASGIHGALGDNGQTFKSIKFLVDKVLGAGNSEAMSIVYGCGQKST